MVMLCRDVLVTSSVAFISSRMKILFTTTFDYDDDYDDLVSFVFFVFLN